MGVIAVADEVLRRGRLPTAAGGASSERDPQPVAFGRAGDYGAVLFVHSVGRGEWMAIVALLTRAGQSWDEVAIVHKPWWDPHEPFEDDELVVTGGHSRFEVGEGPAVAVVGGQAAAHTSIAGSDGEIVVHAPSNHFIYVAAIRRAEEPVTLTARCGDIEQTSVFEPLDVG